MSLWAHGDKKNGKRSFYFISPDPLTGMIFGISISAMLLPLLGPVIRWLNSLLQ